MGYPYNVEVDVLFTFKDGWSGGYGIKASVLNTDAKMVEEALRHGVDRCMPAVIEQYELERAKQLREKEAEDNDV